MLNQVGSTIFKRQSLTRTSMTFLLRARSSLSLCSFSCRSQRTWNDIKWPNRTRHQSYCHTNQHHAARLGPLQGPPFSPHASSLTFWSHLCPASWTGCDWEPYQSLRGIKRKGYFNITRRSPPHNGKHLKHLELGWFHVRCIMYVYLRMLSLATFLIKVRNDSSLKPTSRSKHPPVPTSQYQYPSPNKFQSFAPGPLPCDPPSSSWGKGCKQCHIEPPHLHGSSASNEMMSEFWNSVIGFKHAFWNESTESTCQNEKKCIKAVENKPIITDALQPSMEFSFVSWAISARISSGTEAMASNSLTQGSALTQQLLDNLLQGGGSSIKQALANGCFMTWTIERWQWYWHNLQSTIASLLKTLKVQRACWLLMATYCGNSPRRVVLFHPFPI